ncbi:hypothetical protein TKK_0018199 [Trichogramma kaykai]
MDIARSEPTMPALEEEAEVVPLAAGDAAETVPIDEVGPQNEERTLPVAVGDAEKAARVGEIELQTSQVVELEQQDKECARKIAIEINQAREDLTVTMRGEWQRLQARLDEISAE